MYWGVSGGVAALTSDCYLTFYLYTGQLGRVGGTRRAHQIQIVEHVPGGLEGPRSGVTGQWRKYNLCQGACFITL